MNRFWFSAGTLALGGAVAFLAAPSAHAQTVVNNSFEIPSVGAGGIVYNPAGATFNFVGNAGITANNSGFTSANAPAPDGVQVAFLQTTGSFSQGITGFAAGNYTVSFFAAQRANAAGQNQRFSVAFDGNSLGIFTPAVGVSTYQFFTTPSVALTAGTHTLSFSGLGNGVNGNDVTAFVDNIQINRATAGAAPEPGSLALLGLGMVPVAGGILRRRRKA